MAHIPSACPWYPPPGISAQGDRIESRIAMILSNLQRIEFLQPEYFWVFLLLVVITLWALLRRVRFLVLLLRFLALSFLVFALADPVVHDVHSEQELFALLDVSSSIPSKAEGALLRSLRSYLRKKEGKALQLTVFAKTPSEQAIPLQADTSETDLKEDIQKRTEAINTGETNIALALEALGAKSQVSSMLLLTDGFETSGNAQEAARTLAGKGAKVFPIVPDGSWFHDEKLTISSLEAPLTAHADELVPVRASIKNNSAGESSGTVEIWLDREKLFVHSTSIPAHEEKLILVKAPPMDGGLHRIKTVITSQLSGAGTGKKESDDKTPREEKSRWLSIKNKSKILLLSGSQEDRQVLKELLSLQGHALEDIVTEGNVKIPSTLESYTNIILNNVPYPQLPQSFLESLKGYVSNGGGLLLVGGDRSFGLGGYINTPLEEISPLKFVPPQTTARRLNTAVVLLIDKSRSMAEDNKIESAKAASLATIEALKDDDYVSVIGFDATPFVIIKLQLVADVQSIAERRLRNLTAVGKTILLPALAAARQSLGQVEAGRKHIILLSDGKFGDEGDIYLQEMNRARKEGITLSAIAVGGDADVPFMELLSHSGKGKFYHTLNPAELPQIFLRDVRVTMGEETLKEREQFPVVVGPAGVHSTALDRFPELKGFVETLPKKGSQLELITRTEDQVFPILSSWNYGQGKVIAFTSDANGRWSKSWVQWPDFAKFWGDLVESMKNPAHARKSDIDFDFRYSVDRKTLLFDLAIYDNKLKTQLAPHVSAHIIEPGGQTTQVSFDAVRKGKFAAKLENARPGDYRMEINYGNIKFPPVAITISGEAFGEVSGKGIYFHNLEEIARLSGGTINPQPSEVIASKRTTQSERHLFLPLVIAAFLLVLIEAFVREVWMGG